ncbi:helix-turn-helix transcriptional regulator [Streptomyces glaucosporus]|uniref:Helix-turn-helix transcriptional regulator n=1 Tax=Streptomyces glaucosporus TaxID=284044 RepID=A0ABP5W243_9ACTN
MASSRSAFAELLRAWRDRLSPADAGFTVTGGRRAPGLRREELAQLAGLSSSRGTNATGCTAAPVSCRPRTERSHVPAGIQRPAARLGGVPTGVFTADWTLVWWNAMWSALHGDPAAVPPAGRNLARALFGDGAARAMMRPVRPERGQDAFEASIVADLKDAVSRCPGDAGLDRLVRELRDASDAFARHRAARTAATRHTTDRKTVRHPEVGDILLDCDILVVPDVDLRMVAYTAATGSSDAGRLDLLRVTGGRTAAAPS